MEGSALSERDLIRAHAESAHAILLFADRFCGSARNEDLSIQFQVWAQSVYLSGSASILVSLPGWFGLLREANARFWNPACLLWVRLAGH